VPKKVTPPPAGVWKLVARAQRVGLSEGLRGKGGTWLAVGVGAWGLQRIRTMAAKEDEILLREPLGPGETMTIRHETITRAEAAQRQKQSKREQEQLQKQVAAAEKAAKKARKGLSRAERRQIDAQKAQAKRRRRR
jgi:hypothetical protein